MSTHQVSLVTAALIAWLSAVAIGWYREGLTPQRILGALWVFGLVAVLGGRIHALLNLAARGLFPRPVEAVAFWNGMHAPGAIIAITVVAPFVLRALQLPFMRTLDVLMPSMLLGIAAARVGCFLNGCCFGRMCDAAYCLRFPRGSAAFSFQQARKLVASSDAWSLPIHPFALYLAGTAVLAAASGIWLRERRAYEGQAGLVALTVYLVGAAIFEPLRENYYAAELSWAGRLQFEWLAWVMATVALIGLVLCEILLRPRTPHRASELVHLPRT